MKNILKNIKPDHFNKLFLLISLSFTSYAIASGIIFFTFHQLSSFPLPHKNNPKNYDDIRFSLLPQDTWLQTKKQIIDRNIFHPEGKYLPEPELKMADNKNSGINIGEMPCSYEETPFKIAGILLTTREGKSSVIVTKEDKSSFFKVGDTVSFAEDYSILSFTPDEVAFQKGNLKICVKLKNEDTISGKSDTTLAQRLGGETETVEISEQEVQQLLGISQTGTTYTPATDPNDPNIPLGFRFLKIDKGTIFEKLGFKRGDIVEDVNGHSQKNIQEGSRIWESLMNEREISIQYIRDEKPHVKRIMIR